MSIHIHAHLVRRQTAIDTLSTDEAFSIEMFKKKSILLRDAKIQQKFIPIAKSSFNTEGIRISFDANNPSWEVIESLAIRYRFFFADKEPTHALNFLNLIYRKSNDAWAKNYIALLRKQYNEFLNDSLNFAKISPKIKNKDIIDLWFNSEIFHSDQNKQKKLNEINEIVSKEASIFHLNTAMRFLENQISAVYHVIHKTCPDHLFIYTPNHHFETNTSISTNAK